MESGAKSRTPKSRIPLLTAVLISLSVCTLAAESQKCYWCGPLAEQVHRSHRTPPCTADAARDHVTACDPGLAHCAVIATSPPYVESRLCVKFYQDECYSLYCNSTKTWRMTCPCKGDLCNGHNTKREQEAFAILAKLVAKSHSTRIKRTLILLSKVISGKEYKIDNVNATENYMTENDDSENAKIADILSDQSDNENFDTGNISTASVSSTAEVTEEVEVAELIQDDIKINGNNLQTTTPANAEENKAITEDNDSIKTDKITIIVHEAKPSELPTAEALQQNASPDKAAVIQDDAKINENDLQTTTQVRAKDENKATTPLFAEENEALITDKITIIVHETKPSELPTAEALQQNASPADKSAELTPTTTAIIPSTVTVATTHNNRDMLLITIEPTTGKNNTATQINKHVLTPFIGIILHNYLL